MRQHEAREPHLRNPLIIAVSVVIMIFLCLAVSGILISHFSKNRATQKMSPLGIISAPDLQPLARFPKPNLEIDDGHNDSIGLRAQQISKLNTYGWIDRSNGVVRIPIARAMDLILQNGLPTRTNVSETHVSSLQFIQERPEQP